MKPRWFDAVKGADGKPHLESYEKLPYRRALADLGDGEEIQISVRKRKRIRSSKTNRFYWGVIIRVAARELGYADPDELHEAFVYKFRPLPADPVTGLVKRARTSEMTTDEFSAYVSEVRTWLECDLGMRFPEEGEWIEAA